MPKRNIRLLIEYDGAAYAGWQCQADQDTVQEEIQTAISQLTGELAQLQVAGRTDSGVHAVGQVANFHTDTGIAIQRFAPGLNHYLPNDISIHQAEDVPLEFNAKRHSLSKWYRYRVYRGPQPAALESRAWLLRTYLNTEDMRAAAQSLLGRHDFEAFRTVHCDADHAVRTFHAIHIETTPRPPVGEYIDILFHAESYCRHMCRILAGTLVEVGMQRRSVESVQQTLASRDRARAGVTAPAMGLTLLQVLYPPEFDG